MGLVVAKKADSQDIFRAPGQIQRHRLEAEAERGACRRNRPSRRRVLGAHEGILHYTIGQRRGIGSHREPLYVVYLDAARAA